MAVDPKVDTQIDGGLSQGLRQHGRLWVFQDGRMVAWHATRYLLRLIDRIIVANSYYEALAPIGIGSEVTKVTLINRGVRNLDQVAVESYQNGRTHIQLPDIASHTGHLYQVTHRERSLHAEENACQKVLDDVPKSYAYGKTYQSCAADYRHGQLGKPGNAKDNIDAEKEDDKTDSAGDHFAKKFRPNSLPKQGAH